MGGAHARPLDRAEAFFWLLDRCSSMNFAVLAEGSGPLDAGRFEAALAKVQPLHPALGVAIEADEKGCLSFVPRPGERIALCIEPAREPWRDVLAGKLAQPFEPGAAPLARAHWFEQVAGRWACAIVFHHAIGDGRSGLRLMAQVLEVARGSSPPLACAEPRASLMALFPEALAGEAGATRAQAWKAALRRENLRPETMPGFVRSAGPVQPRIIAIGLDETVTRRLARRAREHGTSVHGLIGAAELVAAAARFGEGTAPALMLTSPVDLRRNLAAPVDDSTPGFYVTLLSSVRTVAGAGDLWPLAKCLTADLRRQIAEGCGHLFYHLVPPAETIPANAEGIAGFGAYLQRMPTAFVLSNVGRVEPMAEANGVRVDEMSFALCPMAHQPLFVAASTWGGRLTLNVVHDANRLSADAAQGIAARMQGQLRQAAD